MSRYVRAMSTAPNYTIISADTHAGGSHEQYREYLDPAVARGVRRLARPVQEPVEGPAQHRPAGAQLGRRPPRRRRAGRRRGRRGAVPQHRAAVLPGVRALRRAAQARGLRAAPGRASTRTTGGWSTSAPAARSGAPASARSSSTTSTTRSPTPPGSRSTACAAACCSRTIPPGREVGPAALRPRVRPPVGGAAGPRHPGASARRHRLARLRPPCGGADHHGRRAALLREPQPRAHAAVGRVRAVPAAQVRDHRVGSGRVQADAQAHRRRGRQRPQGRDRRAQVRGGHRRCRSRRASTSPRTSGSARASRARPTSPPATCCRRTA